MAKKAKGGLKANINVGAMVTQSIGTILLLISVFMPAWLSNPTGLSYYPFPRSWGLFQVTGRMSQSLFHAYETQCKISATMSVDVVCITPLCKWYDGKCTAYRMQAIVSYATGVILLLLVPFVIAANIWALRRKTSAQKFATTLSLLAFVIPLFILAMYINVMSMSFDIINSGGYYPVPQPSVGLFLFGAALFFFLCGFLFHFCRGRQIKKESDYEKEVFWEVAQTRFEYGI